MTERRVVHPPDGGEPASDNQHWLDLLAGRAVPDADERTCKEAAWLRAALLSYRTSAPPGGPAPADERVVRLLERARRAAVLAPAALSTSADARREPPYPWRYAVAAGIAVFAAALIFLPDH